MIITDKDLDFVTAEKMSEQTEEIMKHMNFVLRKYLHLDEDLITLFDVNIFNEDDDNCVVEYKIKGTDKFDDMMMNDDNDKVYDLLLEGIDKYR